MYAIMATIFGSLGQVLMTSGMKRGTAGTSALGNYTAVSRCFSFGGRVKLVCPGSYVYGSTSGADHLRDTARVCGGWQGPRGEAGGGVRVDRGRVVVRSAVGP